MAKHRNSSKTNRKQYYKIYEKFNEYGADKFYIELIESYECKSKDELSAREGHYIRELKPTLNSRVAGRTNKQYYDDNIDTIREKKNNIA